MENVSVNRGLLIGIGAVAAVSLLALAFVLGRESGSGGVPAPRARIERVAPRAGQAAPPTPRTTADRADAQPDSPFVPPTPGPDAPARAAAGEAPAPVGGDRNGTGFEAERASVAAYFEAVDRIQLGAVNGQAEGIANEMAAALANGDTSGLDRMIRDAEAAKAGLSAVAPPPPCATHHRETVASLDDAIDVLRSLKVAMESSEPAARLADVSARATTLRTRADALEKEELALRERYGLKR